MRPALDAAVPGDARLAVVWMPAGPDALELLEQRPSLRRLVLLVDSPEAVHAWRADPRASALLRDPRVRVAIVADGSASAVLPLPPEDDRFLVEGRVGFYLDPTIRLARGELCARLEQTLLDRVRAVLGSVAHRVTRGWHAMAGAVLNLPRLAISGTIEAWRNTARDRPAVVVGAGPSLDRNVHELAAFRERLFIVACDAALATLQRAGVRPDLVVSTDHAEKVWRFFAALEPAWSDVPVACIPGSAWPLIRHHPGAPAFGVGRDPRDALFDRLAGPLPVFDSGQCVGHAAFELACLAGAAPVIMIGFDLGYAGDRFHARDMAVPYFHDSPPQAENVLTVPGALGGCIRTEVSMLLYLREFERRFAACGRPVWDATEGGAAKAGTRVVPLRTALEEVAGRPAAAPKPMPAARAVKADRAERVRQALLAWRDQAPGLLEELRRVLEDLPGELARFAGGFAFQDRFPDLLDLVSGANNPVAVTRFQFELEDWLRLRESAPVPPARLLEAGRAYLEDAIRCVELVPELAAMALSRLDSENREPAVVLAVRRAGGPVEPWSSVRSALETARLTVRDYEGDPDDVPAIWARLRETRAGAVVMLEGALFPASWAMPGAACFDIRLNPPGADAFLEQWHWLPGYAVVGADPEVVRAWRGCAPADCPVFGLLPDGRLQPAGEGVFSLGWPEAVAARLAAALGHFRASAKTA
jgi:hypothetical protein